MTTILLSSLAGCSEKELFEALDFQTENSVELKFHILPFCSEDGVEEESKSEMENCLTTISGINVLVYDLDGNLLPEYSVFSDRESLNSLTLPAQGRYRIYFFANVPDLSSKYPHSEQNLDSFGHTYGSYGEIKEHGLPMCYTQTVDLSNGGVVNVWFRRLATRLEVSFDKSALSKLHRQGTCLHSLRVCQGALDIYPFAPEGSRALQCTSDAEDADKALDGDVDILNAGGTCYIYLLTNMQGLLLPPGTAQADKVPDRIGGLDADGLSRLSYIEARCTLDCDDWSGDDVVMRHYIGGSAQEDYNRSFDIFPNRTRRIRLVLKENDPLLEPWRFCSEGNVIKKRFSFSSDTIRIQKNFSRTLTVSAPFDFELCGTGENCSASLVGSNYDSANEKYSKTYSVSTDVGPKNLLGIGERHVPIVETLRFRSLARSKTDTCVRVEIFNQVLPLTISSGTDGTLRVFGENPLHLGFDSRLVLKKAGAAWPEYQNSTVCYPSTDTFGQENILGKLDLPLDGAYSLLLDFYPHWDGNIDFFMGEGNRAMFGPGAEYSPGNCHPSRLINYGFQDESRSHYVSFDSNIELECDISNTVNDSTAFPKVFCIIGEDRSADSMLDPYMFSWGCPTKAFGEFGIQPFPSSGHNNCDNYRISDFEHCPFYFTNGCLQGYHIYIYTHKWNSSNMNEKVEVKCYRPGRDILPATAGQDNEVRILFIVYGKNSWGDIGIKVDAAEYSYTGINLIINGCSCWPGGSPAPNGVR